MHCTVLGQRVRSVIAAHSIVPNPPTDFQNQWVLTCGRPNEQTSSANTSFNSSMHGYNGKEHGEEEYRIVGVSVYVS